MKKRLLMTSLMVLLIGALTYGQSATATLPAVQGIPGDFVSVPITVTNFNSVGAITLKIKFNLGVLSYVGVSNQVPGFTPIIGHTDTTVSIVWSSLSPITVANGTLIQVNFQYHGTSTPLTFFKCVVASGVPPLPVQVTYNNGSVTPNQGLANQAQIGTKTAASSGALVSVPLYYPIFTTNAGSLTQKIQYDPSVLTFQDITPKGNLTGTMGGAANGIVSLAWTSLTGANIGSPGDSIILNFIYNGTANTPLNFSTGCVITTTTSVNIPVSYFNGMVIAPLPTCTPSVTTEAISAITANTASGGGTVTSDGGFQVTERGVCWSTSANPTLADSHTSDGSGLGAFTSAITGLTANTTYHVRSYATNSCGTSYGEDIAFTTACDILLPVSVTIGASANPVCADHSVTFTATPINGGTSPTYQWKVNSATISGATNSTFIYAPSDGDQIYCVLTSNATCVSGNPATSNTITMSVTPSVPVSVTIGASATIVCAGTPVTFNAVAVNGGASPSYQWKINSVAISGATNSSFTYTPLNGQQFTCVLTSSLTCVSGNPATSNIIAVTVNPLLTVGISITASSQTVCTGSAVTFTATPVNGGSAPVYQWQVNGTGVGASSPTYTYVPANGDVVRCILTSNVACPTGNPATSNSITMTVHPDQTPVISGPVYVIVGSGGITYTTNAGMTNYNWSVTSGGTITAGAGTRSITVTWSVAGTHTVTVAYTDPTGCSASTHASLAVVVANYIPTSCSNSNFHQGTFDDWSGCWGTWINGLFIPPCLQNSWTDTPNGGHFSIETAGSDPCIPQLQKVFPGDAYSALIGARQCTTGGGGFVDQVAYPITYDPNSSFISWRSAVVFAGFDDPAHVTANQRPRFQVTILDHNTGDTLDLPCGRFDLFPGDGVTTWNAGPDNLQWKDWSITGMDLSRLTNISAGQQVDIVFQVHGCALGDHTGYAYVSLVCQSMTVSISGCEGNNTVQLTAPPGFATYEWQGPVCATCSPTTTTGSTLTVNNALSGWKYFLTMTSFYPSCTVRVLDTTLHITSINPHFEVTPACVGLPSTFIDNSVINQHATSDRIWNFGDGTATVTVQTATVTHTYTTPGSYLVSLTRTSSDPCSKTYTATVTINPQPVPTITGATSSCLGATGVGYATEAGKTNYLWSIEPAGAGTITAGMNTNSILVTWNTVGINSVKVNYTDEGGCTAALPATQTVTVYARPVPTITGAASACKGSTGMIYLTEPGNSNYNWILSSGGTITAGAGTASITVTWTDSGMQLMLINYTDIHGCNALMPGNITVMVNPLPTVNHVSNQVVCNRAPTAPVVFTGSVAQTQYSWINSDPSIGLAAAGTGTITTFTALNMGTIPITATIQVTPSYTSGVTCTGVPTSFTITVNPTPQVVPVLDQTFCNGDPAPATILSSTVTGATFSWTNSNPTIGLAAAGSGNIPAFTAVNSGTTPVTAMITVIPQASQCEGPPIAYQIVVNPSPVPTIAGPATACINAQSTFVTEAGMTGYNWSVSTGGTIVSGINTNQILVQWLTTGSKTVEVSYTNLNQCTALVPSTKTITVVPLPVPSLSGTNQVCQGNSSVYTTESGMTNYQWNVSPGGSITSGGSFNSSTVTVKWNTPGAQSVSVSYTDVHGCTPLMPSVWPVQVYLSSPSLSGPVSSCEGATGIIYTTDTGKTGYAWTISPGGTITSGAGTHAITVTWTAAGQQSVGVTYNGPGGCFNPNPTILTVNVISLPGAAGTITGPTAVCVGSTGIQYSIEPVPNATTYLWTVPAGAVITGGAGTPLITVDFPNYVTAGVMKVSGNNSCGDGATSPDLNISVNALLTGQANLLNFTVKSGQEQCLAVQTITTGGSTPGFIVENGGTVTFIASQTIAFLPTSTIREGGYLRAYITTQCIPCNGASTPSNSVVSGSGNTTRNPAGQSGFVRVYPNPTYDQVTVELTDGTTRAEITVYSMVGEKLFNQALNGETVFRFELSERPAGIYLVHVQSGDKSEIVKIVKR